MKKFILTLGLLSLVIFLIKTYYDLRANLIHYSVYYAQNLDHDPDYDPVMAMIVDNLDYIPRPENDSIYYDFDGHSTIHSSNDDIYLTGSPNGYSLVNYFNAYEFTGNGKFLHFRIMASKDNFFDSSPERKQEA
ncbi:hypothetical protein [Streptococcus danieliae]|uniref:Uncharacterized protein n=1 Tax=Streptococcus danieliae TaxID=747656 RepID=A0A7Z0M7M7_9STRE|nr:hypothetical protein [Streptococcus danieliae]MBF0700142.1 hypothetical protein [Streptococcus danieliae]NYS97318.1 hypothetical protein [Streptococcus danieliae]